MFTNLRLKIRAFIKKHKWKIILFIIGWAILFAISNVLLNRRNEIPITTFDPYKPIINNGQTTPEKYQNKIEDAIEDYINYCNNKEYEKAYNMIEEKCRNRIYPTLDSFKAYVNYVFAQKRLYTIKNYSNQANVYIYRIRIFEDIMATGLTYSDTFKYFEEKFTFTEKDGNFTMGVKGYVGDEQLNAGYDNQYMKIAISNKSISYDEESYTVSFQNKTQYYIVISNEASEDEVDLIAQDEEIKRKIDENWREIYIPPNSNITMSIYFTKFFDLGIDSTGIRFNNIRVLRSYSGENENKDAELDDAVDMFSVTIPLK